MHIDSQVPQIVDVGVHLLGEQELMSDQRQAAERVLAVLAAFKTQSAGRPTKGDRDDEASWLMATRPSRFVWLMGGRGQGKTSTLLYCCDALRKDCVVAQPLEPEWLQRDEDPFLAIAAALLDYLESGPLGPWRDRTGDGHVTVELLREELFSIASDIAARSRIGADLLRQDFEGISGYTRRVLANTQRHSALVARLRRWFTDLLRLTGREMVILPIDDVDVARSQTMAVLNAARWYLCHPNVAVIFTADHDTVHRAILNELLAELPPVFTGGGGAVPAAPQEESTSARLQAPSREELLAQEYAKDDDYARLLLQKLAPSGYRAQIRGLPPASRLTAGFSSGTGTVSLADLLDGVPLLSAVGPARWYETTLVEWSLIETTLRAFVEKGQATVSITLKQLIALYPTVLPNNLRQLINCINEIAFRTAEYRQRLQAILYPDRQVDPGPGNAPATRRQPLDDLATLTWPARLEARDSTQQDVLRAWQEAEDRFVIDVIGALGHNPEIEDDSERMVDDATGLRLLEANTANEFAEVMTRIRLRGTQTTGPSYVATKRTGERQRLTEASCALVSIFKEYTILRAGSPWAVLGDQELQLQHRFQQTVPSSPLFDWWGPHAELERLEPRVGRFLRSLRATLDWSLRGSQVSLFYDRLDLGAPACFTSLRQAARYAHVLHAETDRRLDQIAEAMREAADRGEQPVATGQLTELGLMLTYRTLGMIAQRGNLEVTALHQALSGGGNLPSLVGGSFSATWPWLVANQEGTGNLIVALLRGTGLDVDLVGRFLLLLRLGHFPLAPALTAWRRTSQSGEDGPAEILAAARDLLREADAAGLSSGLNLDAARLALGVEPSDSTGGGLCPQLERITAEVDYINLDSQAATLALFVDLLQYLEGDGSTLAGATPEQPPAIWQELRYLLPALTRSRRDRPGPVDSPDPAE